jgi:glycosyltransferase involved in cell wall biosynthesis
VHPGGVTGMATPHLSVCVPAYNSGRTLDATLRSILRQDVDFELVVLNNASSDDTNVIAKSFDDPRVRVFGNDEVLDIGDNWNKAIALSSGQLVKVVCADDVLMPGSLAAQLEVMADQDIAISSAKFDVIDEEGTAVETQLGLCGLAGFQTPRALMRAIIRRGPAAFGPTAAAMFRRKHFDRVGGIRGDLVFPMDVDLFGRVSIFGMFFGMAEIGAAWRNSTFNMCSRTSTLSKLSDMYRFHHRIAHDYPELITRSDVIAGDIRLLRSAFERLTVRTCSAVTHRAEGEGGRTGRSSSLVRPGTCGVLPPGTGIDI